jgi:hypothetical protein
MKVSPLTITLSIALGAAGAIAAQHLPALLPVAVAETAPVQVVEAPATSPCDRPILNRTYADADTSEHAASERGRKKAAAAAWRWCQKAMASGDTEGLWINSHGDYLGNENRANFFDGDRNYWGVREVRIDDGRVLSWEEAKSELPAILAAAERQPWFFTNGIMFVSTAEMN